MDWGWAGIAWRREAEGGKEGGGGAWLVRAAGTALGRGAEGGGAAAAAAGAGCTAAAGG